MCDLVLVNSYLFVFVLISCLLNDLSIVPSEKSLILFQFITFCLQEVCIYGWLQLTSKCTWFTTEFRIILMRTIFGFNDKFTIGKEYVVHTIIWYISAWKIAKKMLFYLNLHADDLFQTTHFQRWFALHGTLKWIDSVLNIYIYQNPLLWHCKLSACLLLQY